MTKEMAILDQRTAAVITIYNVPNYGSVLQAYATQQLIEKFGWKCDIIQYRYPNEWHIAQDQHRKTKFYSRVAEYLKLGVNSRQRRKIELFRRRYYHFTQKFNSLDELNESDWSKYNVLIAGSDQLWNAKYTLGDKAFLLSFAPNGIKRISLSSSCATSRLPEQYVESFKKELEKFSAISVREENSKKALIEQLRIHKSVKVISDPTLLLTAEEWQKSLSLEMECQEGSKEPYILFYRLDYAFSEPNFILYSYDVLRYFIKKTGIQRVIAISGYSKECICGIKMEQAGDVTPIQFVSLFSHAALVVTSSFHGTAFSLNFCRPLVSITPSNTSKDDRQASLLKLLGLEQCISPVGSNIKQVNPVYDKDKLQIRLSKMREDGLNWIDKALNITD